VRQVIVFAAVDGEREQEVVSIARREVEEWSH
jgi:hypothetical protein